MGYERAWVYDAFLDTCQQLSRLHARIFSVIFALASFVPCGGVTLPRSNSGVLRAFFHICRKLSHTCMPVWPAFPLCTHFPCASWWCVQATLQFRCAEAHAL